MGHLVSKDLFKELGDKLSQNGTNLKAINNEKFQKVLKSLYTEEEACLALKMPYNLSTIEKVAKVAEYSIEELEKLLPQMAGKGLVIDLMNEKGEYEYAASPIVFGFFEFTMMRTGKNLPFKEWAELFHDYMGSDDSLYKANFGNNEMSGLGRAIPYEESLKASGEESEILSYESVLSIIADNDKFAVGTCSCRHEKYHTGEKACDHPMDNCLSLGNPADYLIRNKLAKEITREETLELVADSKKRGLVFIGDNVKKELSFICQCCGCCCNMLQGINKFGYLNAVTSSTYIAKVETDECVGCKLCAKACPVSAIELNAEKPHIAKVISERCIGCGVCVPKCKPNAIKMNKRAKKVFHPENFLEKAIVANLEHGTLQNFIFDNPNSSSHAFMRVLLGGFLKLPPVKKALVSDLVRSKFLRYLTSKS